MFCLSRGSGRIYQIPSRVGILLIFFSNTIISSLSSMLGEVPSGCAAALKCTPIEYCTAEGVMSNTTVVLTRDQEAYRVPLTVS